MKLLEKPKNKFTGTDVRRRQAIEAWREETRAVLMTLEKDFDSLIARSIFNVRYASHLLKLSNEIWIMIIEGLLDEQGEEGKAALFMLGRTCRKFRHMMESPRWEGLNLTSRHSCKRLTCNGEQVFCPDSGFNPPECSRGRPFYFNIWRTGSQLQSRVRELLLVDELCASCELEANTDREGRVRCKFASEWILNQCHAGTSDAVELHWDPPYDTHFCVGTEGLIRLCAHNTISWGEVRKQLLWAHRKLIQEAAVNQVFVQLKSCNDPSHRNPPCEASEGPEAMLVLDRSGAWTIEMTWQPHSGPAAFPSFRGGKFKAEEMRELFRGQRRRGADYIVPSLGSGWLPEMTCFPLDRCDCLSYGDDDETRQVLFEDGADRMPSHRPIHKSLTPHASRVYGDLCRAQIKVARCPEDHAGGGDISPCLATTYLRVIEGIFLPRDKTPTPSHAWLHAMDRDSYEWEECRQEDFWLDRQSTEMCNTPGCRNTFQVGIYGCYEKTLRRTWGSLLDNVTLPYYSHRV